MPLDRLTWLAPPPTEPVNTGTFDEWNELRRQIGLPLPDELFEYSATYGSGVFVQDEFSLEVHSVFRPGYDHLVEWNRRIFEQEAVRNPELYTGMYEVGGYSLSDDEVSGGRLFWDTRGAADEWKVGITRPVTRYGTSLVDWLVGVFSGEILIPGFPRTFDGLRFEKWERESEEAE